jgi:hypothetical protein
VPDFAWPAIKHARCSNGNTEFTGKITTSPGEMIIGQFGPSAKALGYFLVAN